MLAIVSLAAACRSVDAPAPWFAETDLLFTHVSGAKGDFYLPEIMGSGIALLDYDGDGDLDIFLLQGHPSGGSNQLLRNDHGVFTDVTGAAGLQLSNYGMGAATADIDNDGDTDLLVTGFGGNRLYRNNGDGTFTDATAQSPALGCRASGQPAHRSSTMTTMAGRT